MRTLVNFYDKAMPDHRNKLVTVFEKDKGCLLDFLELDFKKENNVIVPYFKQLIESEQDRHLNKYRGYSDQII